MAKKKTPPADGDNYNVFKEAADEFFQTVEEMNGTQNPNTAKRNNERIRTVNNLDRFFRSLFRYADLAEETTKKLQDLQTVPKEFIESLAEWAIAQYEQENRYIEAELLKPEYEGKTRAEIEAAGIDENGQAIPGSLYEKVWAAAIRTLERDRWINFEKDLQPQLQEELQKPEYGGRTLEDLRAAYLENKEDGSLYEQAINAADMAQVRSATPTAKIKRADIIEYPLDKVNSEMWRLLEKDTGGQIAFKAEKDGSKQELTIYYSIDFDDLQGVTITRKLEPFDKRVYIAVSALFNAGNNVITLTQIHYAMGNSKRPNKTQLQKIYDSVRKMTGARVYVNNEDEAKVYTNYPVFKYEGSLLPLESLSAIVNGQLTNAAIHIFREPPIVSFARQRNQLTTVKTSLLDSPISKTNGNLAIDDYLIERIARAKNGKQPCKILYSTICKRANLTTPKQRQRVPETVKRYLDHYKKDGYIKGYNDKDPDGVTIIYADK